MYVGCHNDNNFLLPFFFTEWFLIYQLVQNFDLEYVGFKDQQSSIYQLCEFSWTSQRCADPY